MEKPISFILILSICININAAFVLSDTDTHLSAFTVSKCECDTINFYDRLLSSDNKLVLYCANWCPSSYKELNRLYSEGVIDSLKRNDFSLIILSDKYPCLYLHNDVIESGWDKRILEDFEIYYEVYRKQILKQLSGEESFPFLLLIKDGIVVKESHGLQNSYLDIISLINKKHHKP